MSEMSKERIEELLRGRVVKCSRCNGEGWLDAIGPKSDGSYITSRPCSTCNGNGHVRSWDGVEPMTAEEATK